MYHGMAIYKYIVPSLVLSTHVKVSSAKHKLLNTCAKNSLITKYFLLTDGFMQLY